MPADDSLFEKALARQLRNNSPEKGEGVPGAQDAEAFANCPDGELLAAYHERVLPSEEMNWCKEHIVSCARCQEILSLLESSEDVPAHAHENEFSLVADESEIAMLAPRAMDAPRAKAATPSPAAAFRTSGDAQPQVAKATATALRKPLRYWIAPLGAVAAALLVWIVMHGQKSPRLAPQPGPSEVALNRDAAPLPETKASPESALVRRPATSKTLDDAKSPSAPNPRQKEAGRAGEVQASPNPARQVRIYPATPRPDVPPPAPMAKAASTGGAGTVGGIGLGSSGGLGPGSGGAATGGNATPPAASQTVEVISENGAATTDSAQSVPPSGNIKAKTAARSAPGMELNTTSENAAGLPLNGRNVTDLMSLAPEAGSPLILAPGGDIEWRAGGAGRIEKSMDASAHWTRQKSHVKVDLTTGSAPSKEICWIVGEAGTILRTVDGGTHWKRLTSPLQGEIAGVRATDALHATVWNADRSSTFATSDGGASWRRVTGQ